MQYCPHGLFYFIVRHIVRRNSGNKMTSLVNITWYFDYVIQIPFSGQNSTTLKGCKIVNFKARLFKLWNRAFLKINFQTKQKQFSVHRHFNRQLDILEITDVCLVTKQPSNKGSLGSKQQGNVQVLLVSHQLTRVDIMFKDL